MKKWVYGLGIQFNEIQLLSFFIHKRQVYNVNVEAILVETTVWEAKLWWPEADPSIASDVSSFLQTAVGS